MTKSTETTTKRKRTTAARVVSRRRRKPTAEQIAERAYFLHLERGGDPFANWLDAERELVTA